MTEDEGDEKPFEASAKKLEDARRKGEIPRSTDLNTAAAYSGFALLSVTVGPSLLMGFGALLQGMLRDVDRLAQDMFPDAPAPAMGGIMSEVALQLAPWCVVPAAAVVLSIIVQRSFTVAPTKLAPKWNRISPLAGLKNKFGRKGLFEFAKSALKLVVYCIVLAFFLKSKSETILASAAMTAGGVAVILGRLVVSLLLIVCAIAWCIGTIDFLVQRADHLRKHRMTRKEMTDELKTSEGDPTMKQQRRQKAVEIATNQMMKDVPGADVVIVNPTHYAVALTWSRMPGEAPTCVAKGTDEIAARIRALAMEHGIPIHSDPPAARALHAGTALGAEISPDHYAAVAAAIRFAEQMRHKVRQGGLA